MENNISEIKSKIKLGDGAQFWGYISPSNDTKSKVTRWKIQIEQQDGNWADVITSNDPYYQPKTPNLSGIFNVIVIASGPNLSEKELSPLSDSKPQIGCNSDCAGMIGIVSNADGTEATFWTVWNALCG